MKICKTDPIDWDMAFYQFQIILHDFASMILRMKRLNEKVLFRRLVQKISWEGSVYITPYNHQAVQSSSCHDIVKCVRS
jgi:hypothetical protein